MDDALAVLSLLQSRLQLGQMMTERGGIGGLVVVRFRGWCRVAIEQVVEAIRDAATELKCEDGSVQRP